MPEPVNYAVWREALTLIARLEMVSHGVTKNYDSDGRGGGSDESAPGPVSGHRRAPKSDDGSRELGDGNPEYMVLRQRLDRAVRKGDGRKVREIRDTARDELRLARRGAEPKGPLLEKGSLAWKRYIAGQVEDAKTAKDVGEIARVEGISRATAYNYRRLYGESEAA